MSLFTLTVDHADLEKNIRDSLRAQLAVYGYFATDDELTQISRNVSQTVLLMDTEAK